MKTLEGKFEAGQYREVVRVLTGKARSARELAVLGSSLVRVGRLGEAEAPLSAASALGDPEGQVELGNLLRLLGRFEQASAHLQASLPNLSAQWRLRALRWLGVAEFQAGRTADGLHHVKRAWCGCVVMGDDEATARATQTLAQLYTLLGDHARAELLLTEAIRVLPARPDPSPRLSALQNLVEIQTARGDFCGAHVTLAEAKRTLQGVDAQQPSAWLLRVEADLLRAAGDDRKYAELLERLVPLANEVQEYTLRVWTLTRLADRHSLAGRHGEALETLLGFGATPAEWPAELWTTSGVLARRRGHLLKAEADLTTASQLLRQSGAVPQLIRVLLHLAAAAHAAGHQPTAASTLREALAQMLRLNQLWAFRPDLEELSELLRHAMLSPDLAPYTEPVLDRLSGLAGLPHPPREQAIRLQVATLGRVGVFKNGQEVKFKYSGSVPLLVYIALQPGRTRAEMQRDLYPEKNAKTGAAYLRQILKELRDKLGHGVIHFEGQHHAPWYRLGRQVQLDLDLTRLRAALSRGEVARALALYRGEFLPGLQHGQWTAQQREQTHLALTSELRLLLERFQAEGEHHRVILLVNQFLRAEPDDRQALEARVAAAKIVASPPELARYLAALNRTHN